MERGITYVSAKTVWSNIMISPLGFFFIYKLIGNGCSNTRRCVGVNSALIGLLNFLNFADQQALKLWGKLKIAYIFPLFSAFDKPEFSLPEFDLV